MNKLNVHKETVHSEGISYIKDPPPIVLPFRYVYILHQRPAAHHPTCQVCLHPTSKTRRPLSYLSGMFTSYIKDPPPIVLPIRYVYILHQGPAAYSPTCQVCLHPTSKTRRLSSYLSGMFTSYIKDPPPIVLPVRYVYILHQGPAVYHPTCQVCSHPTSRTHRPLSYLSGMFTPYIKDPPPIILPVRYVYILHQRPAAHRPTCQVCSHPTSETCRPSSYLSGMFTSYIRDPLPIVLPVRYVYILHQRPAAHHPTCQVCLHPTLETCHPSSYLSGMFTSYIRDLLPIVLSVRYVYILHQRPATHRPTCQVCSHPTSRTRRLSSYLSGMFTSYIKDPPPIVLPVRYVHTLHQGPTTHHPTCQVCLHPTSETRRPSSYLSGMFTSYIRDLPPIVLPVRYVYILHQRPAAHRPICQVCLHPTSETCHPSSYLSGMFTSYIKDPPSIILPVRYVHILHQGPTAHCPTCQVCLHPTSETRRPSSYLSGMFTSYIRDLPPIVLPVRYVYILHQRPAAHRPICQVCLHPTSETCHPSSYLSGMFTSYIKDPPSIILPVRYVHILHQGPTAHCPTCQVCSHPTSRTHHPSSYLSGMFTSYIRDLPPIVLPVRYVHILHQRPAAHRPTCQVCLHPTSETRCPSSYLSGMFTSYIRDPPPIILPVRYVYNIRDLPPIVLPVRYVYILHQRPAAHRPICQVCLHPTSETCHPSSYLSGMFTSYIRDPPSIVLPLRYVHILHQRPTTHCPTSQVYSQPTSKTRHP